MNKADAISSLAALGQETRLDVFRLLVQAGKSGLSAGEIAAQLQTVQNTLSAHLRILNRAQLIRSKREGRTIRYFADMNGFGALLEYLMKDCCNGEPALCQPVIDAVTCEI